MAYYRPPAAKTPTTSKGETLFAVGWRAFVNSPHKIGEPAAFVPFAATERQSMRTDLIDGQEVEILAWRPFASGGLSYQIRRLSDGSEYWVLAHYLRKAKQAPQPA